MRNIPLSNALGRVHCVARLNQRVEGWLLLDTGATSTLLYRSVAERAQVQRLFQHRQVFILGKGSFSAEVGVLRRLELAGGRYVLNDLEVVIVEDTAEQDEIGILGMNAIAQFGRFVLTDTRLTLYGKSLPTERFAPLPTKFTHGNRRILVRLRMGAGESILFDWDTGSDTTIISPNILPAQLHRRQGRREKVPRSEITVSQTDAAGTEQRTLEAEYWWRFPSVRLGAIELNPFPVFEFGKPTHLWSNSYGLLGSPLLTEFEVLHDFSKQQLYMRRYRQNLAGTYGLMLTLHETPTGLGWKAFLNFPTEVVGRLPAESGVELLAVNDIPVSRWETIPLIRHLLFPPARRRCKIRYRANGKVAEAVLQAVGVPYIGVPPQLLGIVQVPKAEVGLGRTPERRVLLLKLSPRLRGVRGAQRQLNVRYVEHRWRFD